MSYIWGFIFFLLIIVAAIAGGVHAIAENAIVIFLLLSIKNFIVDMLIATIKGKHNIFEGFVFFVMNSFRVGAFCFYMYKFVGECMSWGGLTFFLGLLYSLFYLAVSGSMFLGADFEIMEIETDPSAKDNELPKAIDSILGNIFACILIFLNYHFAHFLVNVL